MGFFASLIKTPFEVVGSIIKVLVGIWVIFLIALLGWCMIKMVTIGALMVVS